MNETSERRMPVLFIGHGSPMNAIENNPWSRAFRDLAGLLPMPRAILSISAHWYLPATLLTANAHPGTIHDFGGFPRALFEVQYPAPGSPDLAERVLQLVGEPPAALSGNWGIDHGTWSVLVHLFPEADVPVVQLSIASNLAPSAHLDLGRSLAPLRDEGVLVMGSGNITHNLRHAMMSYGRADAGTPEWADRFDADIAAALEQDDRPYLTGALAMDDGRLSHPTPDHYLPLLYAAGAAGDAIVAFPITGFDLGSLSMRAALWA